MGSRSVRGIEKAKERRQIVSAPNYGIYRRLCVLGIIQVIFQLHCTVTNSVFAAYVIGS